jgi:putative transposase
MIGLTEQLASKVGVLPACMAVGTPRSSLYRRRKAEQVSALRSRPSPKQALTEDERLQVLDMLNSDRFLDLAPRQVYATLLDEGRYLCSWRTMYRILSDRDQVRERRRGHVHRVYEKPELLTTCPNSLWTWDITRLKGPVAWTYYYLYVLIDVFSRYVTGFMVACRESAELAGQLVELSCQRQDIEPDQLRLHSDRGPAMIAKSMALLLSDLGVTKSHSRPHVSNDNPFSEAQFKTLKYHPSYPQRFGSIQDARLWARMFFDWYNNHHRHSSLGLMTPAMVHYGKAETVREQRLQVLNAAYRVHPERFVNGQPNLPELPQAVWINPPKIILPAEFDVLH